MRDSKETVEKSKGRPKTRQACEYKSITISIPAWMAKKLSEIFLKEGEPSRKRLIESLLAKYLGYSTRKSFEKKCQAEALKEAREHTSKRRQ